MSRVNRVYLERPLSPGEEFALTGGAHHHLSRVLRVQRGETVRFFNHLGREYLCRFVSAHRKGGTFVCERELQPVAEPAVATQLDIAICKSESMDFSLQKATELGVSAIQPLVTAYGAQTARLEHWRGVVQSACEQCGRAGLPEVKAPIAVRDMRRISPGEYGLVFDHQSDQAAGVQLERAVERVHVAIGPAGGWRMDELSRMNALGFKTVYLGPRALRSETAAVAGLAIVQHQLGALE